MQPQLRYTHTSDGVQIAYAILGTGPSLMWCRVHGLSVQAMLEGRLDAIDALTSRAALVLFDHGGVGASQREISDFSIDAQVRAIEAVADCLSAERFTLLGHSTSGSASAAAYAARHPERLDRLVCIAPLAWVDAAATATAIRADWSIARRRWASIVYPDGPVSAQRSYSTAIRDSMTADVAANYYDEYSNLDLPSLFGAVSSPTLLIARRSFADERRHVIELSAVMPDCQVLLTDNVDGIPDKAQALAILDFMGVQAPAPEVRLPGSTAIILFADIVDSTALTERMGDAAFHKQSEALHRGVRETLASCGGRVVEGRVLGDGVMAVFDAAKDAIAGAVACHGAAEAVQLQLHVGIHAGDVIRDENDVHGGAVNIAARIASATAPAETLVSDVVRALGRTSAGVAFEDRGEHTLKGVGEPVRLYAVRPST